MGTADGVLAIYDESEIQVLRDACLSPGVIIYHGLQLFAIYLATL